MSPREKDGSDRNAAASAAHARVWCPACFVVLRACSIVMALIACPRGVIDLFMVFF